ncbi:MAG: S-adenosylmethionine:tRNA ribosyltransferase-isomerase [Bacteroidota bacterium]
MNLKLADFIYDLPEDRIAKHPPRKRDGSKLLFYNKGAISHHQFSEIDKQIPDHALVVFNNTKVIPARIVMHKETGAKIEIFLLEPLAPSKVHEEVMNSQKECTWKCMIGNAKKWGIDSPINLKSPSVEAIRTRGDLVRFRWNTGKTFSDLIAEIGKIPLPPYINREVDKEDQTRYQTIYSKIKGAVAAPTAGLHFTEDVLKRLTYNGIDVDYLTLHVSAGTFQPVKSETIEDHLMHNEQIWVTKTNVMNLLDAEKTIAVGTTSMRAIESLYWYGVKLLNESEHFFIDQKDPYRFKAIPKKDALQAVLSIMDKKEVNVIRGQTQVFIYPGYDFKLCDGLVTNYHLPGSTLILLIAAFIGDDWRKVYEEALSKDYRFLSYGDCSLLLK